ncbi:MAG: aminodeoxychorismate/anthranilate synthase component II [Ignavibacteriaceae bacterium]|jgi:anthranilate synthase/aminodeoxychorismate synthase-like glutamine amidotransferase|nr:aminodeoxychorismate/anthranilate synthase component II [Ignavibacteriaceae bacterium]
MRILVIDNYDSFTFNLVHLIGEFENDIIVKRNDKITISEIEGLHPDKIVISPGPGRPEDSHITLDVIKSLGENIPILGVCLGHQAIGYCFGGTIIHAPSLVHGKSSEIIHDGKGIYKNIPQNFVAGRYHSLVIERGSLPVQLSVTAETEEGIIMGVRHKSFPIEGIQFHPESILTPEGKNLIKNWVSQ